jgi:hypothetical protein
MNATAVMNNADLLSQEIIQFATSPLPKTCDKCKRISTPTELRLMKTYSHNCYYTHSSLPHKVRKLSDIVTELKEDKYKIYEINVELEENVRNNYLCSTCFCLEIGCRASRQHRSELHSCLNEHFLEEHPDRDSEWIRKNVKKEANLIINDKILFKKHRIHKTQEKADKYEIWIYDNLRKRMKNDKEQARKEVEYRKEEIFEFFNTMKKKKCKIISREWEREIKMTLIAKWFAEKKIPYHFFAWVTIQFIHFPLPTWEQMKEGYEQSYWSASRYYLSQVGISMYARPALPAWFKDL